MSQQDACQIHERQRVIGLDSQGRAERIGRFARPSQRQKRVGQVDMSVHEPGIQPDGHAIGMLGGGISAQIANATRPRLFQAGTSVGASVTALRR